MKEFQRKIQGPGGVMLAMLMLALAGCAMRSTSTDAFTATATAMVNPQMTPANARRDANARAETQARDQIMIQASQMKLADGRTLEDVAAADTTVRAELYDTVRNAHITGRTISESGAITVTLALDKIEVRRIIERYQGRGGK